MEWSLPQSSWRKSCFHGWLKMSWIVVSQEKKKPTTKLIYRLNNIPTKCLLWLLFCLSSSSTLFLPLPSFTFSLVPSPFHLLFLLSSSTFTQTFHIFFMVYRPLFSIIYFAAWNEIFASDMEGGAMNYDMQLSHKQQRRQRHRKESIFRNGRRRNNIQSRPSILRCKLYAIYTKPYHHHHPRKRSSNNAPDPIDFLLLVYCIFSASVG